MNVVHNVQKMHKSMITLIVDHEDWDTVRVSTQSEVKEGDLDDGKDQLEQDEAGVPPHL